MLHKDELAARRWHKAMEGRYGHNRQPADLATESGAMLQAWRDIDVLIKRLDEMQALVRQMELAADDRRDTEALSAVFRPRPPTSDDTITVAITPPRSDPSLALTPVRPLPSLPPDVAASPLPPAPPLLPPPAATLTDDVHNALVKRCADAAETALTYCVLHSLSLYDAKNRVLMALRGLRRTEQMTMPDDEGYLR